MKKHAGSFDFILDCVSAEHDINAYLELLKPDGTLPSSARRRSRCRSRAFPALLARRRLAGSPHRRHRRDPGDARFLRRAQHHLATSK